MTNSFSPVFIPETIVILHKELSDEARRTIDAMADHLSENFCKKCAEEYPDVKIELINREKAREIIYVLVYNGFL
jgi:hypothetical protein